MELNLAALAFSCNCSEMSGLSIWIFGMKALQRSDYLFQNHCGWILRSKLSVLCYVVLKLVFILFCLF